MLAEWFPVLAMVAAVIHAVVMIALAMYGLHSLWLVFRFLRHRHTQVIPLPCEQDEPVVLVQVPVFNEQAVVERVVAAVGALAWPRACLRIQLLDDSTDASVAVGAAAIARLRAVGIEATQVCRAQRTGYKAGALANGLMFDAGHPAGPAEFIAIFDADFVPQPDFLRHALATLLSDQKLAFVQARWEHLNPRASALTQAQAIGIDGHFAVEQSARAWSGLALNFNGSCGVWRCSAIVAAGGWRHDTLTEDLDLSYRVQLAGWRAACRLDLAVPGELPQSMEAWRSQQFRWAKGSLQTARLLLPAVWRSSWTRARKVAATLHLTHYLVHPLILLGLMLAPLSGIALRHAPPLVLWAGALLLACSLIPPLVLYVVGQRVLRRPWRTLLSLPTMTALGTGLAVLNTRATREVLSNTASTFVRTPKDGGGSGHYRVPSASGLSELAAAAWGLFGLILGWQTSSPWLTPILMLCISGFAYHGVRVWWRQLVDDCAPAAAATPVARSWWSLVPLGTLSLAALAALLLRPGSWRDEPAWFAGLALVMGGAYLAGVYVVRSRAISLTGVVWILLVGVVLNVLATGLWQSDDVNRYVVEGRQLVMGQNPYAIPPSAPAAIALVDPAIAAGVNHPQMTAIYPPMELAVHAGVAAISPTLAGFSVVMCLMTVGCLAALVALMRASGVAPGLILLAAWNPVLPIFASGEAHHDIVMATLVVIALLFAIRGRAVLALFSLAVAVLLKPFALVLMPVFLARTPRRWWWLVPALVLMAYLPFAAAGYGVVASLLAFGGGMQFHGALEPLVRLAAAAILPMPMVAAAVRIVLMLLLVIGAWWLWRRRAGAPLPTLAVRFLGVLLLCLPTLHPWYFIVVVVLMPFARTWALPLWTASAGVYWLHGMGMLKTGTWGETAWVTALAHLPAMVVMAYEAFGPFREPHEQHEPRATLTAGEHHDDRTNWQVSHG
jgi:cellulose synthase/poly-beta-1,6-N-acetylglucosamine synthase-like glycosyltransferase